MQRFKCLENDILTVILPDSSSRVNNQIYVHLQAQKANPINCYKLIFKYCLICGYRLALLQVINTIRNSNNKWISQSIPSTKHPIHTHSELILCSFTILFRLSLRVWCELKSRYDHWGVFKQFRSRRNFQIFIKKSRETQDYLT